MTSHDTSRREFIGQSALQLAIIESLATTLQAAPGADCANSEPKRRSVLNVVCIGAHPDDPESGCGGTLARYVELGHCVTNVYLTRGEAGIPGKSHKEAAAIRTAEAEAACTILGAKPLFAGQIDGATEANDTTARSLNRLIADQRPNVLFAHWPIDTHPDHQVAGVLAVRAWLAAGRAFPLYFFEVARGLQTMCFVPTAYVDITTTRAKKKASLFAHKSQNGEKVYGKWHEIMDDFRGREACVSAAEAFASLRPVRYGECLPGLEIVPRPAPHQYEP